MNLKPLNDCLLVELTDGNEVEGIDLPDRQFGSKTSGIVVDVDVTNPTPKHLPTDFKIIGKRVFFEDYKDGSQVEVDGRKYAFIKWEDVRGYEDD